MKMCIMARLLRHQETPVPVVRDSKRWKLQEPKKLSDELKTAGSGTRLRKNDAKYHCDRFRENVKPKANIVAAATHVNILCLHIDTISECGESCTSVFYNKFSNIVIINTLDSTLVLQSFMFIRNCNVRMSIR